MEDSSPSLYNLIAVTINETPDEIVRLILEYGLVEDVVAMERVSSRFQTITTSIISTKTKFSTHYKVPEKLVENNFRGVLKTIKIMKKLKDVSSLNVDSWEMARIKELVVANQGLTEMKTFIETGYRSHETKFCSLKYLDFVKELNPNYTGKGVRCVVNSKDVLRLKEKYSELELLIGKGDLNTPINLNIGIVYATHKDLPSNLRPYVKHLVLDMKSFEPRDLAEYKNMESITLRFLDIDSLTIGKIFPYIVSKLKRLVIIRRAKWSQEKKVWVSTLPPENLSGLKQFIDSHPLTDVIVYGSEHNR